LGRAAGFEPATTAIRARGSGRTELHPVKRVMGHPAGVEPAASGSANRRSHPLSYGWWLALPAGFEPAIAGLRDRRPWPLDDGSVAPLAGIEPASTLLNRQPRAPCSPEGNVGGMSGTRTRRRPLARRRLSLLSYHPESWCRGMESNHRRARLQRAALPLSYFGNWCGRR
jgi:hypothetical protein